MVSFRQKMSVEDAESVRAYITQRAHAARAALPPAAPATPAAR
jgi:hypothetical protein